MNNENHLLNLQKEIKLLKQLGTTIGFYQYYFKSLKGYNTNIECFNMVNDLYFNLYGEFRYSSWDTFKQSKLYKNKK